MMNIVTFWS